MTINVTEQVSTLASDIEDAVADSRTRTMSLATASAQAFGSASLASYVDSAKRGVENALHALAEQAGTQAANLTVTRHDFAGADTSAAAAVTPAGGPQ